MKITLDLFLGRNEIICDFSETFCFWDVSYEDPINLKSVSSGVSEESQTVLLFDKIQ